MAAYFQDAGEDEPLSATAESGNGLASAAAVETVWQPVSAVVPETGWYLPPLWFLEIRNFRRGASGQYRRCSGWL